MSQGRPRPAQTRKTPHGQPKAIPWDALLALTVEDISALFPHGADMVKSGKWRPAGEKPGEDHQPLNCLLREKAKRMERPLYLGKSGGYTTNPAYALKTDPEVGEALPKSLRDEYSKRGWAATAERKAAIPLSDQLADIEDHLRPQQRAELRRRIEGLKRSVHEKAA